MRYLIRLIAIVGLGLSVLHAGPAQAEKRVALVIGNAAYQAVAELPNPKKDARDMAAALRAAAFAEVVERYDLGIQQMRDELAAFEDKAAGADWAVVYYAGHGIEVDGRNYLIPVDAELKRATDAEDETYALDRVLARVAAAGKLQLVILDACRENPFKRRMSLTGVKRAVGERGLARIEPAHPNVIVAYAARDGEAALDGKPGENSPYARALLKHLAEPGLELGKFFRKVRDDVLAETGGRQRPFEYGSLTGQDLFFKPGIAAGSKPIVLPQPSPGAETARICREVDGMANPATLAVLERQHKGTPAGECVAARIDQLKRTEAEAAKAEVLGPTFEVATRFIAGLVENCSEVSLHWRETGKHKHIEHWRWQRTSISFGPGKRMVVTEDVYKSQTKNHAQKRTFSFGDEHLLRISVELPELAPRVNVENDTITVTCSSSNCISWEGVYKDRTRGRKSGKRDSRGFRFCNATTARRVADALSHVIKLAGGKKSPF
jgi:hypothetical protein